MHSLARQKADTAGKTDISRSLTTGHSEENKSSKTAPFWPLPWLVAAICDLSSGAKCLFAKLCYDAGDSNCCRLGMRLHADSLGVDRGTIRRWLRELEDRGLIKITYEWRCCAYYLYPQFRVGESIPLLVETMKRRDVGWSDKLVLCCVSYRQGENDFCWAKQKAHAADLGLSLRTIQRVFAGMKARCEVQIRPRGRNSKQGNKYALTCGAVLGGRIFGANSHTTESPPLYKKWKAKSYFKALRAKFPPGDLSASSSRDWFGPEAVYLLLANVPVAEKVARSLAFIDKHPFESADQAINNMRVNRAAVFERFEDAGLPQPEYNMAGYVINALNGARREGKKVGTTKLFRQTAAKHRAIKIAKARRGRYKQPSVAAFERRRQKLLEQIREIQNEQNESRTHRSRETKGRASAIP
ncbi:hypothetical protein ES703_26977 [subsurface metagenome]